MNLKLLYSSLFCLYFCISFAGDDIQKIEKDKEIKEKDLIKRPYRYTPFYISLGFDIGQFLWSFTTCNPKFTKNQEIYNLDFRGNFLIDFNRLLLNVDVGFLKKKYNGTQYQEHSLLLRINLFFNLIKKNSEYNSIYIGGGININGSKVSSKEYDILGWRSVADNEKFSWFWMNISIGFRKSFCKKIMYFGGGIVFNFCKKELFTKAKKYRAITKEFIYGFGGKNNSLNPSFNIYIGCNIPFKTKDKRVDDEEYYFYNIT